ncbi:MAG: pyridoxal phosphate-dependent aminotransferase [Proteobacteria bacterium]|nr:pyridoxal phosphate-dependent aminotransferase [Pseudomonadota bacterium]
MLKLSSRLDSLEESVTLAITAKAKALKSEGRDIVGLGAGEPDFDTPENIKEAAIAAIRSGQTKYTAVGGIVELKDAIIEKFKSDNGLNFDRSEIIVSCGGKHSIYNLFQALLNPGDEVIIPGPYWVSYPAIVTISGGTPVVVATTEATGFKMTPEAFSAAITPATKAVIINSPSNPTGAAYSRAELEAIAEVALKNNLVIITDDIYEKLVYDDFEFTSIASISKEVSDSSVVLNGVSKAYSMTGWRIGYAAGPKELIGAMSKIQSQSTSNPTSISQWAAVEALSGPQDSIAMMCKEFVKRRDVMVAGLNAIEGVTCPVPHGAFYCFPNVSGLYERNNVKGSVELSAYLLDSAGVAVVPGSAFGDDSALRLSYATSLDMVEEALKRIAAAVK